MSTPKLLEWVYLGVEIKGKCGILARSPGIQDIIRMPNPNPPNQFQPGQSGNPNGRPKKKSSITNLTKKYLETKITNPETGQRVTRKEVFVKKVFALAMTGDMSAIKAIWNYVDGMPTQRIENNIISGETKLDKIIDNLTQRNTGTDVPSKE